MPLQIGQSHDHSFDEPLGLMSDCHRRIETFLGMLERIAGENPGGPLTAEHHRAMQCALHYFRKAAPLHTRDEEDSLFPRLCRSHDQRAAGILCRVKALKADHGVAQEHHSDVDRLCRVWLEQQTLSAHEVERLNELLAGLKAIYTEHIHIEDHVVFPAAAEILSPPELEAMGREMARRRGLNTHVHIVAG